MNKRILLTALLESERLDVITVAELFLLEDVLDFEIVDNMYRVFRRIETDMVVGSCS